MDCDGLQHTLGNPLQTLYFDARDKEPFPMPAGGAEALMRIRFDFFANRFAQNKQAL